MHERAGPMLSPMFTLLLIPFLAAMVLAVNMGGSGTAPSFAAAYGAKLIRKDLIPGLFGVCVVAGALLAGRKVALTLGRGILPADAMSLTLTTIVLLSVSVSLLLANLLSIPQSTSQATVFALVGPALYPGGLQTEKLFCEILPTWFVLPLVAFAVTLCIGRLVYDPLKRRRVNFQQVEQHPALKAVVIAA